MIKKTRSTDTPLAEITLRKYESPNSLDKREAVRKLCLSVGLLQPGDSRDIVVDIFQVLLENHGNLLDSDRIQDLVIGNRKNNSLPLSGIAQSNIRRQVRRLRELFFVEKVKNSYRITENEKLLNLFEERIEKFYLKSITNRVKDYIKLVENLH